MGGRTYLCLEAVRADGVVAVDESFWGVGVRVVVFALGASQSWHLVRLVLNSYIYITAK